MVNDKANIYKQIRRIKCGKILLLKKNKCLANNDNCIYQMKGGFLSGCTKKMIERQVTSSRPSEQKA